MLMNTSLGMFRSILEMISAPYNGTIKLLHLAQQQTIPFETIHKLHNAQRGSE